MIMIYAISLKMLFRIFLILLHIFLGNSFISILNPFKQQLSNIKCQQLPYICNCNERVIYSRYLIGLRKTRRFLNNATNVNALGSIVNFTQEFVSNYSSVTTIPMNATNNIAIFNNTESGVKNIIMGNMVLDVSNVQQIHISTKKDKIIIELDKKQTDVFAVINNLDTYINTLSLLGKIINIS